MSHETWNFETKFDMNIFEQIIKFRISFLFFHSFEIMRCFYLKNRNQWVLKFDLCSHFFGVVFFQFCNKKIFNSFRWKSCKFFFEKIKFKVITALNSTMEHYNISGFLNLLSSRTQTSIFIHIHICETNPNVENNQ